MKLTISVIIPTFNRAELISAAIDSALRQTRVPDEIIVVDDGSTDATLARVADFGPPVRVIAQANRGCSAARNAGLRMARGDLIVFLDSDDLLTADSLARRAAILESSPDVDVVYGDMLMIDADGKPLGTHRDYMPGVRPSGDIFAELALRCFVLMPAMVRRRALREYQFDEQLGHAEDYDLWRRVAADSRFRYVDEPVACYRIHDANTVTSQPQRMQERELEVQSRFFAMPAFARLDRGARARVYRSHGAKRTAQCQFAVARHYFARAIAADPLSAASYAMLASSLLTPHLLRRAILARRARTMTPLVQVAAQRHPVATRNSLPLNPIAS